MEAERWARIREVFERVMDVRVDKRRELLDSLCRDDAGLRREVEELLASAETTGDELDRVIASAASGLSNEPLRDRRPSRIGAYRILDLLGRGGMGAVYLAERSDRSFQHRVALKVLHAGVDTAESEARFRSERQILADLRHPNIARLVDGGAAEDGSPYLVTEYVEGRRVDRWCDEQRLDLRRRIELFQVVCSAVQAAHSSLVVHRDLKPANILVTADGHPKLLDFGIAKLMGPAGHGHTLALTRTTDRLLTPSYASPEQLTGQPVTTAADVYSPGVILYELLTGRPPLDFSGMSLGEVERTVTRTDPVRPSAVVRDLARRGHGDEVARAENLTGEAVDVLAGAGASGEPLVAALNGLSEIRGELGDQDGARRAAERALEAAEEDGTTARAEAARALSQLGWLTYEASPVDEAEGFVKRALAMQRELYGENHPTIAESLFRLGTIQLERNHIDEAARLHEAGLAMKRDLLGEDHPDTLSGVGVLVATLEAQKEHQRGLERLEEALPVVIRVLGPDHPEIGYLQVMRGRQLRFLKRWQESESAFAEALRIERATC